MTLDIVIPEAARKYVYYEETDIVLLHGDCMEILPLFETKSVDLVLTDPPYNDVNRESNGLRNLDKGIADSLPFDIATALPLFINICGGSFYFFCGTEQVSLIRKILVDNGLSTRHGIWEKSNPSPMNGQHIYLSAFENVMYAKNNNAIFNGHCIKPKWVSPIVESIGHPTMKPIKIIQEMINVSSNVNDIILDPFLGSGTTAVAAKNLGRRCIGIEIEKKYLDIAVERLRQEILC